MAMKIQKGRAPKPEPKVFVIKGSPAWDAWQAWRLDGNSDIRSPVARHKGKEGWWFKELLPPPRPSDRRDDALLALAPAIAVADRQFEAALDKVAAAETMLRAKEKPKPVEPKLADPRFKEMKSAVEKWSREQEARRNHPRLVAYRQAVRLWEKRLALLKRQSGLAAAELARDKASDKTIDLQAEVAAFRATTLRGLIFKATYAAEHYPDLGGYDVDVMASIVDDLLAMQKRGEAADV
jgi:hypothetical protein